MLTFNIHYQLNFGDAVYISGNSWQLGNWNAQFAIRMKWTEVIFFVTKQGDIWVTTIPVHDFEYKYFIAEYDNPINIEWEAGPNRNMEMKENTSNL